MAAAEKGRRQAGVRRRTLPRMQCTAVLTTCRRPRLRAWLGALAVALLFVAQAFASVHKLDSAAHANGDPCAICVSVASLGAGAAAHAPQLDLERVRPLLTRAVSPVVVSPARIRPAARGPPVAVLTF
jgi:hypothetical protein